jgi:hypothetical protein
MSVYREKHTNIGELSNKEELDLYTVYPTNRINEVIKARRQRKAKYIDPVGGKAQIEKPKREKLFEGPRHNGR